MSLECGDSIDIFEYDLLNASVEELTSLLELVSSCSDCSGCDGTKEILRRKIERKKSEMAKFLQPEFDFVEKEIS